MSESQISKRLPPPSVRVSSMDDHRLISNQPEPKRPGQRPPREGMRGTPLAPVPAGVTIAQKTTIHAQTGRGAKVVTPARPTPAAAAREQERREATATVTGGPLVAASSGGAGFALASLTDGELALVTDLVRTFAAHAGGEALETATSVLSKLAAQVDERDERDAQDPAK